MENELRDLIIKYSQSMMPRLAEYEIQSSKTNIVIWAVVLVAMVAVLLATVLYVHKKKDEGYYDDTWTIFVYTICPFVIVVGLFFVAMEINDIQTATYLPEKILIRYIDIMLRNM